MTHSFLSFFLISSISILSEIFSMFWYLLDVLCYLSLPTSSQNKINFSMSQNEIWGYYKVFPHLWNNLVSICIITSSYLTLWGT
jgi:hypothetical protein